MLFSCTRLEQEVPVVAPEEEEVQGKVLVKFNVTLPELTPSTKSLSDTPNGDLQTLHIAVFGSSAYLKEYVQATFVPATTNGKLGESTNRYEVSATLTISENSKRRIHIIGNGPDRMDYDQETTLIPPLLSVEKQGAYWQSFIVPGIKAKRDADGNLVGAQTITVGGETVYTGSGTFQVSDETAAYFSDIALIRNFAKIVVEDETGSNFTTRSFAVVNVPNQGSIAPYYSGGFVYGYETKSYIDLNQTLHYPGLLPIGTTFDTSVPSASAFENPTAAANAGKVAAANQSFFMYERPVPNEEQQPTVVIVYGHYSDPDTEDGVDDSGDFYYKVDLMENKDYYPIYRNFKYRIRLQKIMKPGADTPEDALVSMGSGDVSADISTQTLTDISDGTSRILVTYMAKTLIRKYPFEEENGQIDHLTLKYKFIPDVTVDSNGDGEPDWNNNFSASTPTSSAPVTIELQHMSGGNESVIDSYTVDSTDDSEGWRTVTITTKDPSANVRSQYLRITGTVGAGTEDESALFRNVTYTMLSKQTMTVSCNPEKVQKIAGELMEVGITIPKNLPASMFPLKFYIESDALSLTPDNGRTEEILRDNNLPVISGTSIIPGHSETTFKYVRTLSKTDYDKLCQASKFSGGNTVTLSCFFKTNKAESASRVYVENEYFNQANDNFRNFYVKQFTDLEFTNGVPTTAMAGAPFTFSMDTNDALPEIVYFQCDGVRPTATSGLQRVSGGNYDGWYWYSPTQTDVSALRDNYNPIINFATTREGGTATVTINAEEYTPATLTHTPKTFPVPGFYTTAGGNTARTRIGNLAGMDVYYRFSYANGDSDRKPVKLQAVGLGNPTSTTGTITGPVDGYYTYTPNAGTAYNDNRITWKTLAAEANSTSSVTLSSNWYSNAPVTNITRVALVWRTANYTINLKTSSGDNPSYTTAPQNVVFSNTVRDGSRNNYYQIMGNREYNWGWQYLSGSFTVTAPSNYEEARITSITMVYSGTNYQTQAVTVVGDVSGSSTLSTKTSWNSSSTGEGNGDNTVTVTMACTSNSQYNNRNRLTSVTVNYGYWEEP